MIKPNNKCFSCGTKICPSQKVITKVGNKLKVQQFSLETASFLLAIDQPSI